MYRNLKFKGLIILAVILFCGYYLVINRQPDAASRFPTSKEALIENLRSNIRLGLDLRGGSHLVVEVQTQDAFKAEADGAIERLKEEMSKQGITFTNIDRTDPQTLEEAMRIEISVTGVPLDKTGPFRSIVTEFFPQWSLTAANTDYRLRLRTTDGLALSRDTVTRSVETIKKRIDGLGVSEATVVPRERQDAEGEIVIQMPGVDDPVFVKDIIGKAAVLEITEVKDGPSPSLDTLMSSHGGVLPLGTKAVKSSPQAGEGESWYLLARTPVVTGNDLKNARAMRGEFGRWETDFTLSQDAARRFGRFTESHIGNRLAIVLDNQVMSAPTIQSRIEDSGRITGAANEQDAAGLAIVLRAGSLPASLKYIQETTVGPSLGADSIRQGFLAGLAGLIGVVVVILLYYKKSGINATLALILNAIILIAILSYFEAVLTLPGIAGIVLTIGMAVDSNVLIFERIREELRAGKAIPAAIDAGFSRAFLTIIDTHVTTVVSCAFLFIFGSGPVKGFAVTLSVGLLANLFTAVFVSRSMFEWAQLRDPQMERLSI